MVAPGVERIEIRRGDFGRSGSARTAGSSTSSSSTRRGRASSSAGPATRASGTETHELDRPAARGALAGDERRLLPDGRTLPGRAGRDRPRGRTGSSASRTASGPAWPCPTRASGRGWPWSTPRSGSRPSPRTACAGASTASTGPASTTSSSCSPPSSTGRP
ncbi:MAG: hypothetical protein MZV64_63125 [Ignavibacteriales bacterium]|nr:hypothetical protein [Ignavibacteriales bacterium]